MGSLQLCINYSVVFERVEVTLTLELLSDRSINGLIVQFGSERIVGMFVDAIP